VPPLSRAFGFHELAAADLIVDCLYRGGTAGNIGDDPLSKLIGCGNQGGFRRLGSLEKTRLCVLYSSLVEEDWPDSLDSEFGLFTYFGDNRRPGNAIHDTTVRGNDILRTAFDNLHQGAREAIPPFLVFTKAAEGKDVVFRGLAVPGSSRMAAHEDLVAIWRSTSGQRFQNYRATFTILDVPALPRSWLADLRAGRTASPHAPDAWRYWVKTGAYRPLVAPPTIGHRSPSEQLPATQSQRDILVTIINYFKQHPKKEYAFEACAAELVKLMDAHITECDLTRPWRDGGRDALGRFKIGPPESPLFVEFALEAKCKALNSGSGVKETSRLISRLRHRQFGIFVTTSYISEQAYKEICEDRHPVVVLSGRDIASLLFQAGHTTRAAVESWLTSRFPS
jgi:hypothetical protein